MWRIGRHPHHPDPPGGGLEVDVVEAGAPQRYQPHAALHEPVNHRGVALGVDEDAYGIHAAGQADGADGQALLEVVELEPVVFVECVERLAVVALGVEDRDFHFLTFH